MIKYSLMQHYDECMQAGCSDSLTKEHFTLIYFKRIVSKMLTDLSLYSDFLHTTINYMVFSITSTIRTLNRFFYLCTILLLNKEFTL